MGCLYEGNRNLAEIPEFKSLRPEKFFRPSSAVYIHGSALQGRLKEAWRGAGGFEDFIFELEYKKDGWYPLEEDKKTGTLTLPKNNITKPHGGKAWTKFAPSTHVGFRGPM